MPWIARIWAPEHRLRLWLEVELAALDAMAAHGRAPAEAARAVYDFAWDEFCSFYV